MSSSSASVPHNREGTTLTLFHDSGVFTFIFIIFVLNFFSQTPRLLNLCSYLFSSIVKNLNQGSFSPRLNLGGSMLMYKCEIPYPNTYIQVQTHWVGKLLIVFLMNYFIFFYPERLCERNRVNLHVSSERVRMFQST